VTPPPRRRVVVTAAADGITVTDGSLDGEPTSAGNAAFRLFGADAPPLLPPVWLTPVGRTIFPPPGGVRVALVVFGTRAERATATAPVPEDLAGLLNQDAAGLHATDTVDVGVVLSGRVHLCVPGHGEILLAAGDTFVQAAAPHSWRNDEDEACVVAMAMIGATRPEAGTPC
jgi:hypothetical protein